MYARLYLITAAAGQVNQVPAINQVPAFNNTGKHFRKNKTDPKAGPSEIALVCDRYINAIGFVFMAKTCKVQSKPCTLKTKN
jgi:hypothetical protein